MGGRRSPTEDDQRRLLHGYVAVEVRSGGMSDVLVCEDALGRFFEGRLAVKIPRRDLLFHPDAQKRWLYECYSWLTLGKHPNVVTLHRIHLVQGTPQVVMEFVEDSLRDRLRQGPLNPGEGLRYAIQVCDALVHATERIPGFVHRDLKPDNILISPDALAQVSDFGIITSSVRGIDLGKLQVKDPRVSSQAPAFNLLTTRVGLTPGTPAYMSPEQILAQERVDARTDIYALGCILFEMLTGRLLYECSTVASYLHSHLAEPAPLLHQRRPGLPLELSEVVRKCLEKDREARYPDFKQLRKDLADIAETRFRVRISIPRATPPDESSIFGAADAFMKLGDYEKSREICQELSHDSFLRAYLLSSIDYHQGSLPSALSGFHESLERSRGQVEKSFSLSGIAKTHWAMGDLRRALEYYEMAAKEAPEIAATRANIGEIMYILGDVEGAVGAFRQAIELSYDLEFVSLCVNMLLQESRFEEALRELSAARTWHEEDLRYRLLLASALLMKTASCLETTAPIPAEMQREVSQARQCAMDCLRQGFQVDHASVLIELADALSKSI